MHTFRNISSSVLKKIYFETYAHKTEFILEYYICIHFIFKSSIHVGGGVTVEYGIPLGIQYSQGSYTYWGSVSEIFYIPKGILYSQGNSIFPREFYIPNALHPPIYTHNYAHPHHTYTHTHTYIYIYIYIDIYIYLYIYIDIYI